MRETLPRGLLSVSGVRQGEGQAIRLLKRCRMYPSNGGVGWL